MTCLRAADRRPRLRDFFQSAFVRGVPADGSLDGARVDRHGFSAPTPFVDEVESTGLGVLDPLTGLEAERAASASVDAQWAANGWEASLSLFGSEIRHPLERVPQQIPAAARSSMAMDRGARSEPSHSCALSRGPLQLIGSYTYLDVTDAAASGGRQTADRVPRHAAELAACSKTKRGAGLALRFPTRARKRSKTTPTGIRVRAILKSTPSAEIRFGETAVFLNAINLTDVRQSDYDPLLRPSPGAGGERVTELWAPVAGRVFNLGVRLEF